MVGCYHHCFCCSTHLQTKSSSYSTQLAATTTITENHMDSIASYAFTAAVENCQLASLATTTLIIILNTPYF